MNKQTRIEKIQEILDRDAQNPFGIQEIPWEDVLVPMKVFKIPLKYLVYNKYNGRILSRTKSLENQNRQIDAETEEGKHIIEELLWNSKIDRNKKTLESLKGGQEKVGIITKDGIIIDGNRRAMLLARTGKFDYFKAVVLNVTLEQNPLEIEKLETSFQMGEDEKLGYNPIEKYLKAKGLYQKLSGKTFKYQDTNPDKEAIEKISDWMGEKKNVITGYLEVMETMDDYLDYLEYNGIYTQLDGREDQFIKLTGWINNFYGEESGKAFDGYRDTDVDDLKVIAYDYIRIKYDTQDFRKLAYGQKESHFFGNKDIWKSFSNLHFQQKEKIQEDKIDRNSANLERHLDDRDSRFYELSKNDAGISFLDDNVDNHYQQLRYTQASGQPEKLVKNAIRALESINQNHKRFQDPAVLAQVEKLGDFVSGMLKNKSPEHLLIHIIKLLQSIKIDNSIRDQEAFLEGTKSIGRLSYQMGKDLKKLK